MTSKRRFVVRVIVVCLVLVYVTWAVRSCIRAQLARAGGRLSNATVAVELHRRDVQYSPENLHLLAIGREAQTSESSPLPGVVVHTVHIAEEHRENREYVSALVDVVREYNYFTLGQACVLALDGEASGRVRCVLGMAAQVYSGSYESDLLEELSGLRQGDQEAQELFRSIVRYVSRGGSGRFEQRHFAYLMTQAAYWRRGKADEIDKETDRDSGLNNP